MDINKVERLSWGIVILVAFLGLELGVLGAYSLLKTNQKTNMVISDIKNSAKGKEVIGFVPYWLIDSATGNYKKAFSTLTYFGLTLDDEAKIRKYDRPGEKEPGWYALESGKIEKWLNNFQGQEKKKSLLVFCSNSDDVNKFLENPELAATNLISDVGPLMSEYGFSDLNLDIELQQPASDSAREKFVRFVSELSKNLKISKYTLTIEVGPSDLINKRLVSPDLIAPFADKLVLMGYDYHYTGSYVTGPIGPLYGAENEAEYDVATAVKLMENSVPSEKIILGLPVYGYEWETLETFPRSGIIPGTGRVASNKRIAGILTQGNEIRQEWDDEAKEQFIVYKDPDADVYHQIFFPNADSMKTKVDYILNNNLGGAAVWAVGYEDEKTLTPLEVFF